MEPKTDLRIVKTYKALTESLITLLTEKPLDEITVNEICEKAMIRRTTFYKHFGDKYELLAFVVKGIRTDIEKDAEQMRQTTHGDNSFYYDIIYLFDYMEKHEKLSLSLMNSCSSTIVVEDLMEDLISRTKDYLRRNVAPDEVLPASPDFLCQLLAGAMFQGMVWWLKNEERPSKYVMAEQLGAFVTRVIGDTKVPDIHSEPLS